MPFANWWCALTLWKTNTKATKWLRAPSSWGQLLTEATSSLKSQNCQHLCIDSYLDKKLGILSVFSRINWSQALVMTVIGVNLKSPFQIGKEQASSLQVYILLIQKLFYLDWKCSGSGNGGSNGILPKAESKFMTILGCIKVN